MDERRVPGRPRPVADPVLTTVAERPEEVARLRGKSPEEVSTAGMLRAYRERNTKKTEVTEVA